MFYRNANNDKKRDHKIYFISNNFSYSIEMIYVTAYIVTTLRNILFFYHPLVDYGVVIFNV